MSREECITPGPFCFAIGTGVNSRVVASEVCKGSLKYESFTTVSLELINSAPDRRYYVGSKKTVSDAPDKIYFVGSMKTVSDAELKPVAGFISCFTCSL